LAVSWSLIASSFPHNGYNEDFSGISRGGNSRNP
jgi:hypothetical protein